MKKFLKLYWPMAISISLFIIYGILIGTIVFSDTLFSNNVIGFSLVLFTLLLVVAIYGEIIYFIIKAANDKKLKHKILWSFIIYFFNVFIIPYYNLKYVCKENKLKIKLLIFVLISIFLLIFSIYIPSFNMSTNSEPLYIIDEEKLVKFKFPNSYHETSIGQYDIYTKDSRRKINFGIFIYSAYSNETAEGIIEFRDSWLKSSREDVIIIENTVEELEDRKITTKIYIGSHNGVRNMYFISVTEFLETDVFVNTLATYLYEDYLDYKSEFRKILLDMEYIGIRQTA